MQKAVRHRSGGRKVAQLLGLTFSGALILTVIVALRHMLETPQRLESHLPGESYFFKWKHGYIFYKVLGAPEAPPLLLLHTLELAASAYEMRKIIEPLSQHYRVYAPDLLGFGLSDRPSIDYSAETYVSLCRDFLTGVVQRPATIVASGISCNFATTVAATSPNLCERLVLISPVAIEGEQEQKPILPVRNMGMAFPGAFPNLLQTTLMEWLLYPMLSTRFGLRYILSRQHKLLSDADLDYFYATTHQFGAQHASMALFTGKLTQNVSQQLEHLQQPVLIIWGASGLTHARHIGSQQNMPPARGRTRLALLPDAGLAVHEEFPETVIATIRSWSEEGKTAAVPGTHTSLEAYCMKCKQKRKMLNATEVTMKNGRMAVRGTCEVCGTSLYRIGGRAEQETPGV